MTDYSRLIPTFIEARSPQGLRASMIKINARHRGMVKFFDIQTYVKRNTSYWIAWYYVDIEGALNESEEI
jgi:hypothetical protein